MKSHELTIQGMSCDHCVIHVKNALNDIDGLKVEDVQIGKARVWFDDEKSKIESIAAKINEAGYKLISIK